MRPYIAFYKGKQIELDAMSSFAAQKQAAVTFGAKHAYDVTVKLADVTHSTAEV